MSDERIRHEHLNFDSDEDYKENSFDSNENLNENNFNFNEDFNEIKEIRKWIVLYRIPHVHSDKLLKILRHRLLPNLPKSTKTLLHTISAEYEIEEMEDSDNSIGEFTYLGIEQGLQDCVNVILHQKHQIELLFNIDGMKPYKSSNKSLWPILCKVYLESDIYKPFTVALYSGTHKPKRLGVFIQIYLRN